MRRAIVVSDTSAMMFTGLLRDQLDVPGTAATSTSWRLATASADDVIDALDDGLHAEVDERGRTLLRRPAAAAGAGPRPAADPEILVLVEPTSAVDAHTEARIAERLATTRRPHHARHHRSPLMLDAVDEVAFLDGGGSSRSAPHAELLDDLAGYRASRRPASDRADR